MKTLLLGTLLLLSTMTFATEHKHWVYGGVDFGMGSQKSDDWNEEDTANGKYYGGKLLYQYRLTELNFELGVGWKSYKVSNDLKTGPYSNAEMKTKAPYLHTGAFYRFSKQFSLGLTANYILDDGLLVSISDKSKVFVGLGAYYSFKMDSDKFDVRVGANIQRSVDFMDREATLYGLSLQLGRAIVSSEKPKVQRKQVVKQNFVHTPKDVTLVTLDETLINFETDSYTLDMRSKALLADLGAFLVSNKDIWEYVEIQGHTDMRGSDYYNNVLSVRRANSVYQELTTLSIDSKKLFFDGAGKQKPVDSSLSDEAFAKNRRVDLKFINVSDKVKFNQFVNKLKNKYKK